jgi:hypothetical protein
LSYANISGSVATAITSVNPTVTGTPTSYSISPALPAGLSLNTTTGVISGTPSVAAASSTYTVTATNAGGSTTATLTVAVNKIAQTITGLAATDSKTFGAADYSLAVAKGASSSALSFASSEVGVATIDATTGLVHVVGVGTTTLTVNQAADANYDAASAVTQTLTVGKAAITVTADAKSKAYGATEPVLTYQVTSGSLVNGDQLTGALTRAPGENVGTYAISSTLANANYNVTFVPANLTVGKAAITVTADAKSKTYGATEPVLTYQITTGALVGSDVLAGSLSRAPGESVGTFAISSTLANANYDVTFVPASLTVGKAAITVTADAKSKAYGATDPALTYQITTGALVGSDVLAGSLSRAPGENVGTYEISSTLANANYDVTFVPANLTVGKAAITVTADAKSKTYGATDPALTYQITTGALVGSDVLAGSLSRAQGENVGTYAISSTLANANYDVTFVPASLTISASAPAGLSYSSSSINGTAGTAIANLNPTVTGTPTSYSISPALPAGLSLSTTTGVISGTPSVAAASNTYTVTATNAGGSTTTTLTIKIVSPAFTLTITRVGVAQYSSPNTTVTHDFIGVPNQTYLIEYSTDLANWTSVGNQSTGRTGSFSVTITESGNVVANWNRHMFFRARLVW